MRNKYFLYIINKKKYSENIVDLLKKNLYIYRFSSSSVDLAAHHQNLWVDYMF
jgi:hypothetical protein